MSSFKWRLALTWSVGNDADSCPPVMVGFGGLWRWGWRRLREVVVGGTVVCGDMVVCGGRRTKVALFVVQTVPVFLWCAW